MCDFVDSARSLRASPPLLRSEDCKGAGASTDASLSHLYDIKRVKCPTFVIPFLKRLPIPLLPQEAGKAEVQIESATDSARPASIPLARLARVEVQKGPNQMSGENGKRRIVISANVRGRTSAHLSKRPRRSWPAL